MLGELFYVSFSSIMVTCTLVYFAVVFLLLVIPHITSDTYFCQKGLVHVANFYQSRSNPEASRLQVCPRCSMLKSPSSVCCCLKKHRFYEDDDDRKSVQSVCSNKSSGKYHSESDNNYCTCDFCEISQMLKQRSSHENPCKKSID